MVTTKVVVRPVDRRVCRVRINVGADTHGKRRQHNNQPPLENVLHKDDGGRRAEAGRFAYLICLYFPLAYPSTTTINLEYPVYFRSKSGFFSSRSVNVTRYSTV